MHNFFHPERKGNSAGSGIIHRPTAAEINRCRLQFSMLWVDLGLEIFIQVYLLMQRPHVWVDLGFAIFYTSIPFDAKTTWAPAACSNGFRSDIGLAVMVLPPIVCKISIGKITHVDTVSILLVAWYLMRHNILLVVWHLIRNSILVVVWYLIRHGFLLVEHFSHNVKFNML